MFILFFFLHLVKKVFSLVAKQVSLLNTLHPPFNMSLNVHVLILDPVNNYVKKSYNLLFITWRRLQSHSLL